MDINFLKQNGVDTDKAIELFGDISIYNETCQDFLDGIQEKLDNLKKYMENKDMPNYAIYAHSIKSDARYLGFTEVAQVALDHEMAGKGSDERFVLKEYPNLVNATNKMIDIVKQYLNGPKEESNTSEVASNNVSEVLLVADDSKLVTNFIEKAIGDSYKIIVAENGEEVIKLLNNPDYIFKGLLLDLNMPIMDGFKVLDYMRDNNYLEKIGVSIITGEDSKDKIEQAFTYHICDMLVKPFSIDDVKRVTNKTVNFLNI